MEANPTYAFIRYGDGCESSVLLHNCCGLQIRPVEEQLKQQLIGKRYCISRKRKSYKGSTGRARVQSVCQISRKEREVVSLYFLQITGRHKALSFVGEGEGCGLAITMF